MLCFLHDLLVKKNSFTKSFPALSSALKEKKINEKYLNNIYAYSLIKLELKVNLIAFACEILCTHNFSCAIVTSDRVAITKEKLISYKKISS